MAAPASSCEEPLTARFQKLSAFHRSIALIIDGFSAKMRGQMDLHMWQDRLVQQEIQERDESDPTKLPVNLMERSASPYALRGMAERARYDLRTPDDDVSGYYGDLTLEGPFDERLEQASREAFCVGRLIFRLC